MQHAMSIDVGITTGYAVVRDDLLIQKCSQVEATENIREMLYSVAMRYMVDHILIEYPVLDKNNPNHNALVEVYSAVDEFVMDIKGAQSWGLKIAEIKPATWKIPPVLKSNLAQYPQNGVFEHKKMSQHEKDALGICYWYWRWSI